MHELVEKGAKLFHALDDFALSGIGDGAFAAVGSVFDELGDFDGEAEEDGRDLRDVVLRAGAAAEIAAVRGVGARFAAGKDLQRQAHVAAGNLFDVAALLNHGE